MTLTEQVDYYLNWLEGDRRVTSTSYKNYRSTLNKFAQKHTTLTAESVKSFLRTYNNPATANTVRTRLLGLAEFLETPIQKVPRVKEPVKETQALTPQELSRLVQAGSEIDSRLGLIIELLGATGLRFHEFQALSEKSLVEIDGVTSLKVFGKGRKHRTVPLNPDSVTVFKKLKFPIPTELHEKKLRSLLHQAGIRAGLRIEVHPHLLRASCASILLNKGVDSITVARILGWSSVDTFFKHYFQPSQALLAKAVS